MGSEELEHLMEILSADEEGHGFLTEWEKDFIDQTRERYKQYGDRISVSEKQWAILERIYAKIMEKL